MLGLTLIHISKWALLWFIFIQKPSFHTAMMKLWASLLITATHMPWCMPGLLTRGFFRSCGRENVPGIPKFYVSGKKPMVCNTNVWWPKEGKLRYHKTSNIRCTKSQNLNDSRLVLQLSLPNLLKPGVKWRMISDAPTASECSTSL